MTRNGRRPTLRDIADRVGVSEAAASFALNGKPGLSEETRRRVLEVVEELDWRPSHAARALSGAKAQTIGLAIARPATASDAELFFMRLMTGLQSALGPAQFGLLIQIVDDIDDEVEMYRRWHAERRVDGVIVVNLRAHDPRPQLLADLEMPAVLAGGPYPTGLIPSASIDDGAAMHAVLRHLHDEGHDRVTYLCGAPDIVHVRRRIEAFESTLMDGTFDGEFRPTAFTARAAEEAVIALLSSDRAPTAVICDNEVLAVSVELTARNRGLRVPHDLAIVSCEDGPICEAMSPPLTALHRDTEGFGADAASMLLRIISGHEAESAQETVPGLVVRGSTVLQESSTAARG